MSYEAVSWAMAQQVGKSSTKFVLVAMAECVNGKDADMLCFPSVQALSSTTEQDRKTVMDNLQRLREMGFIEDTGARRGITGQVPVYRLKSPESGTIKTGQPHPSDSPNSPEIPPPNSTENGTSTKNGTVPVFPPNSTEIPIKQYRFSLPTVPKTGHGTRKEQGIEQGRNKEKSACASMPGVPDQLFSDYLAVRKAKKAGPLTTTAINGLIREAEKAGKTLEEAVTICCERGWQSLRADWLIDRQPTGRAHQTAARPSRHSGFDQLDYTTGVHADGSFA